MVFYQFREINPTNCCNFEIRKIYTPKIIHPLKITRYTVLSCCIVLRYIRSLYCCIATAPATTCEAMELIKQELLKGIAPLECIFDIDNCSSLNCSNPGGGQLTLTLQCALPHAIEVHMANKAWPGIFNHIFNHSEVMPTTGRNKSAVNVTLDKLDHNRIGLQVSYNYSSHENTIVCEIYL